MLIAENVRWDKEGKFGKTLNKYLECCSDEKFGEYKNRKR